jgi:hypothetical protein
MALSGATWTTPSPPIKRTFFVTPVGYGCTCPDALWIPPELKGPKMNPAIRKPAMIVEITRLFIEPRLS